MEILKETPRAIVTNKSRMPPNAPETRSTVRIPRSKPPLPPSKTSSGKRLKTRRDSVVNKAPPATPKTPYITARTQTKVIPAPLCHCGREAVWRGHSLKKDGHWFLIDYYICKGQDLWYDSWKLPRCDFRIETPGILSHDNPPWTWIDDLPPAERDKLKFAPVE